MEERKVLITGAAGNIGTKLTNGLMDRYNLILLDRRKISARNTICADLSTYASKWVRKFRDVSTVIHLAGIPKENANWRELIPDNIDSVWNVCQACVDERVKRLIFASSCHTMGGYRDTIGDFITTDMEPLPDSNCGISKLVGERICKSYSDRYSLSVICLRVGWVPRGEKKPDIPGNPWLNSLWLSTRDLIQVVTKSIEARNIKFEILYAMSHNRPMIWDLPTTMKTLNYHPKDGFRVTPEMT